MNRVAVTIRWVVQEDGHSTVIFDATTDRQADQIAAEVVGPVGSDLIEVLPLGSSVLTPGLRAPVPA